MNEPNDDDWEALDDALAKAEWTENRARAAMQEVTKTLERLNKWRHPVKWLRLRWSLHKLHKTVGI